MKKIVSILIIGLVLVLAACGNDEEESSKTVSNPEEIKMDKDETVDADKVVVSINDTEVKGERYNAIYLQTKMRAYQFGQDIEDKDNIKEITLNEIIAQELIKQEAAKQGIEVTEDSVQKEYESLKSQNEGKFDDYLKQYNLTEESLKEQIRFAQTLNQYMEKEIKVEEVTEADVKEAYEKLKKIWMTS
ncbi:SurA N-terminal domain-containing protein [Ornithinibacillus scapharcae]|uniref:SurA N-terminal domain-containing protein n=1 Tax=Ornithinibacillus scapharcae TaxID=1147159 RepID=UPI000225BF45|nr:SurA N-terminal domain-containing protein [Ornithinibacillus scapharcae]